MSALQSTRSSCRRLRFIYGFNYHFSNLDIGYWIQPPRLDQIWRKEAEASNTVEFYSLVYG